MFIIFPFFFFWIWFRHCAQSVEGKEITFSDIRNIVLWCFVLFYYSLLNASCVGSWGKHDLLFCLSVVCQLNASCNEFFFILCYSIPIFFLCSFSVSSIIFGYFSVLWRKTSCIVLYENLEDYNPTKKIRVLIVFDDMVADMESNKKLSPIVTELFLRGRKLNISRGFFITILFQSA